MEVAFLRYRQKSRMMPTQDRNTQSEKRYCSSASRIQMLGIKQAYFFYTKLHNKTKVEGFSKCFRKLLWPSNQVVIAINL